MEKQFFSSQIKIYTKHGNAWFLGSEFQFYVPATVLISKYLYIQIVFVLTIQLVTDDNMEILKEFFS